MSFIKYIADESHYKEVLSLVEKAKRTVWIGTADIKDLYVDDKPFLALIASLLKKGVEVRLIHAKEPGTAWREDHEKHPILYDGMEREAGILTDDPEMLDAAIEQFDNVWIGKFCKECGRREYCADPITRAKKICIIVGTTKALAYAIHNIVVLKRNTRLKDRLTSKDV